jgi:hypothetical protein
VAFVLKPFRPTATRCVVVDVLAPLLGRTRAPEDQLRKFPIDGELLDGKERRASSVREVTKLRPCAAKSHLHDAGTVMLGDAENGCVGRGRFGRVGDKECFAIKVDVKALAAIDRGEIGGMCNHRMIVMMRACIRIA